jgi:uncharacterized protein (DUF58 family)
MLSRGAAALLCAGIASSILGSGLGRPFMLYFGLLLTSYLALTWASMALPACAIYSRSVRADRSLEGLRDGAYVLLGREIAVTVTVENRLWIGLSRVTVTDRLPRAMRAAPDAARAMAIPPRSRASYTYRTAADIAGAACFGGVEVRLSDLFGLFAFTRFFPVIDTIRIMPLPEQYARRSPGIVRSAATGRHRSRQVGTGTDLHEIRAYQPGDSLRKVAWKAVARTGRLLTREVEAELSVPCTMLVDASGSMRSGRPGATKLDYVLRVAATVAQASCQEQDPCGLVVFTEGTASHVAPGLGRPHLARILRQLAQAREPIPPAAGARRRTALSLTIQAYLRGVDPFTFPAIDENWQPSVVNAWIAEQYGLTGADRLRLERDDAYAGALLERFCLEQGITAASHLPAQAAGAQARGPGARGAGIGVGASPAVEGGPGRDRMLLRAVERVLLRARGRELFVVISDFEGIETSPLVVEAFRLARARHHRVILLSPFTPWFEPQRDKAGGRRWWWRRTTAAGGPVPGTAGSASTAAGPDARVTATEAAEDVFSSAFMERRRALQLSARKLGIVVRNLAPERMVGFVLDELARLKRDRATARGGG